jgi:hypothetical protein
VKYGQASKSAPSAEKLNPSGGIGKRGSREYTHTHMDVHEDKGDLKKGEEEIRNSIDIGGFSNQTGCCLSK